MLCSHFAYLGPIVAENCDHDILHETEKGYRAIVHDMHMQYRQNEMLFKLKGCAFACIKGVETLRA